MRKNQHHDGVASAFYKECLARPQPKNCKRRTRVATFNSTCWRTFVKMLRKSHPSGTCPQTNKNMLKDAMVGACVNSFVETLVESTHALIKLNALHSFNHSFISSHFISRIDSLIHVMHSFVHPNMHASIPSFMHSRTFLSFTSHHLIASHLASIRPSIHYSIRPPKQPLTQSFKIVILHVSVNGCAGGPEPLEHQETPEHPKHSEPPGVREDNHRPRRQIVNLEHVRYYHHRLPLPLPMPPPHQLPTMFARLSPMPLINNKVAIIIITICAPNPNIGVMRQGMDAPVFANRYRFNQTYKRHMNVKRWTQHVSNGARTVSKWNREIVKLAKAVASKDVKSADAMPGIWPHVPELARWHPKTNQHENGKTNVGL